MALPQAVFLPDLAGPLANYPHAKKLGNILYMSGMSSRQKDGSVRGVHNNADGSVTLDIKEQTLGIIEKYLRL